jgi:hypothetical protein
MPADGRLHGRQGQVKVRDPLDHLGITIRGRPGSLHGPDGGPQLFGVTRLDDGDPRADGLSVAGATVVACYVGLGESPTEAGEVNSSDWCAVRAQARISAGEGGETPSGPQGVDRTAEVGLVAALRDAAARDQRVVREHPGEAGGTLANLVRLKMQVGLVPAQAPAICKPHRREGRKRAGCLLSLQEPAPPVSPSIRSVSREEDGSRDPAEQNPQHPLAPFPTFLHTLIA